MCVCSQTATASLLRAEYDTRPAKNTMGADESLLLLHYIPLFTCDKILCWASPLRLGSGGGLCCMYAFEWLRNWTGRWAAGARLGPGIQLGAANSNKWPPPVPLHSCRSHFWPARRLTGRNRPDNN